MHRLSTWHDAITRGGYQLAALLVIVIACSYSYEVVARYFFDAPTAWANSVVAYLLCAVIFLALPEQTRRRAHIVITLLLDRLNPGLRTVWLAVMTAMSCAICLAVFWISARESWVQFRDNILTVDSYEIPKWWVSTVISYGLLSSGLYFLRATWATSEASPATEASQ